MKTKYVVAATFAVLLATATLAYATQHQSSCINDTDYDIDIQIKLELGLSAVFSVLKHTVLSIVYLVVGLLGGLTWTIKLVVGGVLHSIDVYVPLGAKVRVYVDLLGKLVVAVNGDVVATIPI